MKSNRVQFSIIIPIFNQRSQLELTLKKFSLQDYPEDDYEIIVVDDGSEDMADSFDTEWQGRFQNIKIIHQKNSGRSAARNAGLSKAQGEYIIFCDGDRFPQCNYIRLYQDAIKENNDNPWIVYIGCPMDYYGKLKDIDDEQKVIRYSRASKYYKKVTNLYDQNGNTSSEVDWATFLVGNSCMHSSMLRMVNGFDENFSTWGFEHFELAYRMKDKGFSFHMCPNIKNFHIPHSNGAAYYLDAMQRSVLFMQKKHNNEKFSALYDFLAGTISLQTFEQEFSGNICDELREKDMIFYKL